jgi:hypothetical protein
MISLKKKLKKKKGEEKLQLEGEQRPPVPRSTRTTRGGSRL